jgi:hypothetical protein
MIRGEAVVVVQVRYEGAYSGCLGSVNAFVYQRTRTSKPNQCNAALMRVDGAGVVYGNGVRLRTRGKLDPGCGRNGRNRQSDPDPFSRRQAHR